MKSIRTRLVVILLAGTGILWLAAVGWIYWSTEARVERVLDARLVEAARMVNSLLTDHRIEVGVAAAAGAGDGDAAPFSSALPGYRRQLSCQIWALSGGLVGRSESAPASELSASQSGFSETSVEGEKWRVYAMINEQLGVRVLVGDSLAARGRLIDDVITGLLVPAVLLVPLLAMLIWLSVRRGLEPLSRLADALAQRHADDLRPLPSENVPRELLPPLDALNGLFRRVEQTRRRERDFTAFAAHELKTPLAGLKTQAQIALASGDPQTQAAALRQITGGVDRTSRLVRQLLDLAAIEAGGSTVSAVPLDVAECVAQVVEDLHPLAGKGSVRVTLEAAGEAAVAEIEPGFFSHAVRNVLENAILHSPPEATVSCRISKGASAVVIEIGDRGPGMSDEEIERATERFFRGRRSRSLGSGLGLAIAQVAMARIGGTLAFINRQGGGLCVTLYLPQRC